MDGLSLSIPAAARRRAGPPTAPSTRVDRTTSTVDSTLRTIDRS
ncbi:hypothetical protein ACNFJ7_09860 [Sphingomonas sp. HT-1]|nr:MULTISPECIES: hypothetical protein [unclassified Sphingomonas]